MATQPNKLRHDAPSPLGLSLADVVVYAAVLDLQPNRLEALEELLSRDERQRAAKFKFAIHRSRFIAGRGMLREILSEWVGSSADRIQFTYNSFGKPALAGSHVHFNVSHSLGLGLIAVSSTRQVGVDIEHIDPKLAGDEIAERYFSPAEIAQLRSVPSDQRTDAFFLCWTRKEAYVKARGMGLSLPLDSFEVSLKPGEPAEFLGGVQGWSIESLDPAPGYAAAIVAEH